MHLLFTTIARDEEKCSVYLEKCIRFHLSVVLNDAINQLNAAQQIRWWPNVHFLPLEYSCPRKEDPIKEDINTISPFFKFISNS